MMEGMAVPLPNDYAERVYAGVLGKIIGVYLGRPVEGWTYERITAELGEIQYYVHQQLGRPLVVTDDDISGTFTFPRALVDHGVSGELSPAQIGETWLNYLIEERTTLWWGGLGNSTEHTAYLRLKHGIAAPQSGSAALNGRVVSEQIGAQIFIDGWAMLAPGDPERAADLAERAARVSHDGEAVHAARVLAAMEALAFVESRVDRLLDTAVALIPRDSVIFRLIADLREWHAQEPDWRQARARLAAAYGYDRYGGNCHVVPNHGLIILGLLYAADDFQRALSIVTTSGWDTDCNAGNLGCLLGIRNGLAGIAAGPDWRGPVADRLYISSADGGRAITDAVTETFHLVNLGRALAGLPPLTPKGGARFHFELPGAVQGFRPEESPECAGTVVIENVAASSRLGSRSLALHYHGLAPGRTARVATPTFIPPEALAMSGYPLMASPTLYPGQTVRAWLGAAPGNDRLVTAGLYVRVYGPGDRRVLRRGPRILLPPGAYEELAWRLADTGGAPIAEVGIELSGVGGARGSVYLDALTWEGEPEVVLARPAGGGTAWWRAWVNAVDRLITDGPEMLRLIQNEGTGLLIQGTREWTNYRVSAVFTPHLARAAGLAARVQGLRRYYALLLASDNRVRLVKVLDGVRVLAEADYPWQYGESHRIELAVHGATLDGWIDGRLLLHADDTDRPLQTGAIGLVCEEGRIAVGPVAVQPFTGVAVSG
jgi:ADP-ribosylglycohydrolase